MAALNPQRAAFKEYYCNPKSPTFGQIYESGLRAGFSDSYSKCLMSESTDNDWVKSIIKNYKMKSKAEKVLDEMMELDTDEVILIDGKPIILETGPVKKRDSALVRIKQDTAKFVAERLGKDDGWSTRNEISGPYGKELNNGLTDEQKLKLNKLLGIEDEKQEEIKPEKIEQIKLITNPEFSIFQSNESPQGINFVARTGIIENQLDINCDKCGGKFKYSEDYNNHLELDCYKK